MSIINLWQALIDRVHAELASYKSARTCSWCGQPFEPTYNVSRQEFCGKRCYRANYYLKVRKKRQ